MKTRIISGLCMIPLLAVLYFRGLPLTILVFLIAAIGVRELFQGFNGMDINPNLGNAWGSLSALLILHFSDLDASFYIPFWIVLSVVVPCAYIFKIEKHKAEDAMATIFGIIYVEFFAYHILLIDKAGHGSFIWLVAITAFATDIFAYFTGYLIGKHKLCPELSPKKTIEGAIGGVVGSVICTILFAVVTKMNISIHIIILGIFGSVMAQLGDLTASAFKRKMGIKDYGRLIPGHGGVLDRFDSILFTGPVIYYYLMFVEIASPGFNWFK